jgi:hypothetical protein
VKTCRTRRQGRAQQNWPRRTLTGKPTMEAQLLDPVSTKSDSEPAIFSPLQPPPTTPGKFELDYDVQLRNWPLTKSKWLQPPFQSAESPSTNIPQRQFLGVLCSALLAADCVGGREGV